MKTFRNGNVFYGNSHTDLINKTLGTTFKVTQRCGIDLADFQCDGIIAWFVSMDGSIHGYEDWHWSNRLSLDGLTIYERNMDQPKKKLEIERLKNGYNPFRLAFQLDPYETGNRYCCKFVGAFRLEAFKGNEVPDIEYKKVLDSFTIGGKGEYGSKYINDRNDFFIDDMRYKAKIEKLNFSNNVYTMLKRANVNIVGELLEIGLGFNEASIEIRDKIEEFFKIQSK